MIALLSNQNKEELKMSEPKDVVKLAENELGEVAGGMTRNYLAQAV